MKGISAKHPHSEECRNRIAKLMMDEGDQRVESFFDRARVRAESSTSAAASSSKSGAVVANAQTPKRKADGTVETDAQLAKKQATDTPMPTVIVGGSSSSTSAAVGPVTKGQRVVMKPRSHKTRGVPSKTWKLDN